MKKVIWIIIIIAVLVGGYYILGDKSKTESGGDMRVSKIFEGVDISKTPKNYTDPDLGFSFSYPAGYTSSVINDGPAKTILIQKGGKGMELYIAEYGGGAVNSALVKREIKDVKVEKLTDIESPNGIKAATFFYNDPSLGGVWNVWFSKDKHIYQLTAQSDHEDAIKMFVETFSFE